MYDYELQDHKRRDSVKWILTLIAFILVGVMLAGIILGWFNKDEKKDDVQESEKAEVVDGEGNKLEKGVVYEMPKAMAFSAESLAVAAAAGQSVDVKVMVIVSPYDAADQTVDFSVAWGAAPTNGSKTVTDYLTVTPDSDGSTSATVSCKKAFGNDQIIITATTRDGGYTATCTVTFVGKASSFSITSSTLSTKSNSGRGTYYELGTGRTYTFNLNLSNVFGVVGSKNFTYTLGATGSLYFGEYVPQGDGYARFNSMSKKNLSDLASKFITSVSISGTTLTVKTSSTYIENYYASSSTDDFMFTTYHDRYVFYDEFDLVTGTDYKTYAQSNQSALPSCYFSITVKDTVSNMSQTIKLWVVSAVSGVSFKQSTLTF